MARNDEPGFSAPVPGIGDFDAHGGGMSAPGSNSPGEDAGMYQQGGDVLATVPVSHIYDSNAGDVPMVSVHQNATFSAENPLRDPVSGVVTPTSTAGTAVGPSHPNAGR